MKQEEPELFTPERVEVYRSMIREGVAQEIRWAEHVFGDKIEGLSSAMVRDYIRWLGNLRCAGIGFEPLFEDCRAEPPSMTWVSDYSNANMVKTDFFEARSTAYAKSGALVDDL